MRLTSRLRQGNIFGEMNATCRQITRGFYYPFYYYAYRNTVGVSPVCEAR